MKKQNDLWTYVKIETRDCLQHLLAYMQGNLAEKGCSFHKRYAISRHRDEVGSHWDL